MNGTKKYYLIEAKDPEGKRPYEPVGSVLDKEGMYLWYHCPPNGGVNDGISIRLMDDCAIYFPDMPFARPKAIICEIKSVDPENIDALVDKLSDKSNCNFKELIEEKSDTGPVFHNLGKKLQYAEQK